MLESQYFVWRKELLPKGSALLFYYLIVLLFNWRNIALQCCVGFCLTTMHFSQNYACITSLLSLTPLPLHRSSRSSQSTSLGSLCYPAASQWLSVLHMVVYICQCYSLNSSHPLLPICPQVCLLHLHLCSSLQIDLSAPFF